MDTHRTPFCSLVECDYASQGLVGSGLLFRSEERIGGLNHIDVVMQILGQRPLGGSDECGTILVTKDGVGSRHGARYVLGIRHPQRNFGSSECVKNEA